VIDHPGLSPTRPGNSSQCGVGPRTTCTKSPVRSGAMSQGTKGEHRVASIGGARVCATVARAHEVIRIDAAWIAAEPLDMKAGVDTALARVVKVFGARSHHAYMFMNRRANRLKVFLHDGFGLWLCARRLQQGHFMRPSTHRGERFELSMSQLQAFAVGLPWERLDEHAKIRIL